MPAYREGPPPRAIAGQKKRARKTAPHRVAPSKRVAAASDGASFLGGHAGRAFQPPVTKAANATSKAFAIAQWKLDDQRLKIRKEEAHKKVAAKAFRGRPGTLNLGKFPYTPPEVATNARYQGYAERLWPRVREKYGLPKDMPMPKLEVMSQKEAEETFGPGPVGAITDNWWQAPSKRTVRVTPSLPGLSSSRTFDPKGKSGKELRDFAHAALLHEWTHVAQKVRLPRAAAEGGAQAMTEDLAPTVHMRAPKGQTPYDRNVKAVRRKGDDYVHETQFKTTHHPLTEDIVTLIDGLRSRGQSYDQVVAGIEQHGVPADDVESILKRYKRVTDQHGRPRDQVNPGDPDAHKHAGAL